jgi:hypothetical protein
MPSQGEDTTGYDTAGGLHLVPDPQKAKLTACVYFPSWAARNTHGDDCRGLYSHDAEADTHEWQEVEGAYNDEFMFYRPRITTMDATTMSPVELAVYDAHGNTTGLVTGQAREEIPGADFIGGRVTIFYPQGAYQYVVRGTDDGSYGLALSAVVDGQLIEFQASNMLAANTSVHSYSINWAALARNERGVTIEIDQDSDGVFERTITADRDLTGDEIGMPGVVPAAKAVSNGPNPVTGDGTAFFYSLPDGISTAKLMIFNAAGRPLFETSLDVDSSRFPDTGRWEPVDDDGIPLANGPYVYVLIAEGRVIGQGKMVIQR